MIDMAFKSKILHQNLLGDTIQILSIVLQHWHKHMD